MNPAPRRFRQVLLTAFAVGLLGALSLLIYLESNSFHSMVHRRLVSALEQMTGGRVEVGKFTVVPFAFRVEAQDLTIHGSEAPTEAPYAHIGKLVASIKIISIFEREYGFSSLSIDQPALHIIVYPDGTTNQPSPKIKGVSPRTPIEELFSLSINRLEVTRGELIWNHQRIPLDFAARSVSAGLYYSLLRGGYDGYLKLRKLDTKLHDFRPFSSIVSVQFVLAQNSVEVKSLEWSSAHSRVEASGRISDFREPSFTGSYNLRFALADIASIARIPQLRGGTLEAGGTGSYSTADFATTGKLVVKNFAWQDRSTSLRNVSFNSRYDITPKALKLSEFEVHVLGGRATGSLNLANWFAPKTTAGKRAASQERGAFSLRFKDLSTSALASLFGAASPPLAHLKISGSGEGSVEAKWKGRASKMEAAFAVNFVPPFETPAGEIPFRARLVGVYRGDSEELELSELNVATRASVIRASGRLSSRASLRVAASTTDLNEWQAMLRLFGRPQVPIALRNRATFHGSATGKLFDPTLSGRFDMNDFDTLLPGPSRAMERRLHWDSLVANIELSRRAVSARNVVLKHGNARLALEVSALLDHGQLRPYSPFAARVHLQGGDLSEIGSFAGYQYPLGGQVNLTFSLSGTQLSPHGEGHLDVEHGSFNGEAIPHFVSDLRLINGEVQLNNVKLALRDSELTGAGAYNPGTRAFRFSTTGRDFNVSSLAGMEKLRISIAGRMDFTARGSGTVDAPLITANIDLRGLSFDHERAGNFHFEAATEGAELQVRGRSDFPTAELSLDGTIHLRQDWPADLKLHFDRLDVDSVLRAYLGNRVTGHSSISGNLELRGPLRQANQLAANGDLTTVSCNIENVALRNQGPIRFSIARQVLTIEQLRLVGEGTDIAARGTAQLVGDRELDLRAEGRLNLNMVEHLSPELTSTGEMTVAVKVSGTYNNPSLLGNVEVRNASLAANNLPNGLSEMNGTLVFNQDRLEIQSLSARIGGGNVKLSGFMAYSPRVEFNITALGQDVRLRPAGISAMANAQLQLVGTNKEASLSGDVAVVKLNLSPGFDFARYLEASKQSPTLPQANTILNNVRLDVHVVTTPELEMQSSLARLSGEADLHLRGTLTRPVVLGRIDLTEGNIYFSGTKYRLERGEITFLGPTGVKPTLDLEASTHVHDYDITLGVNGTPDKLNFTYRSEPPLPSADIIALLALGRTQNESATLSSSSQSAFSQETSNLILSQALNATLSNRTQRLFGISRIKIDPQGLATETTPTPKAPAVTIEQQVSNSFTLTYTTQVSQTSQQIIQAEYNLPHNISILAVRDQNGVLSLDIRLRQRKK